ncbi:MAG: choice-of-anchor J domain-containing protein [Chitinophagaceae bacterium]|nr:choice-of-anchor J domain-containing protein [Chitinophagaceae bacterium]
MKKFTYLPLMVFLLFSFALSAQQRTTLTTVQHAAGGVKPIKSNVEDSRCGTMSHLEDVYRQNPGLKQANELLLNQLRQGPAQGNQNQRLNAIVTIPIVFHIVLPNPYIVTDADIQAQVDRLNLDYSGLNGDSANVPTQFQSVRGHTQIRFCLAQRTPGGLPTNGIERRASGTSYTGGASDPIKSTASGGLDVWDANQYFNVWVGGGGGILGYATFPGTSNASQQGVVTDIIGTAANPCYVDPSYNMGRTLSHEAGHYFGLFHIWGDDGGACTGSDFRNLPGTCLITDATLAGTAGDNTIGDTPSQGDQNFGCPSGNLTNSCSPNPPGDMYQNYMDYTDDACMTLFTSKQALRMEWVVANCRAGYITSMGCAPPATGASLDAAPLLVVSPGGSELGTGCSVVNYGTPICPGPVTPKMRITNNGLNTMNSVTVGVRIGTGTPVTANVTGLSLAAGQTTVVTLPSINLVLGANVLKFFTSNPNGVADPVPANDTITTTVNISTPVAPPAAQNFDNPSIAPWTVQSVGAPVWQLATPAGLPPSAPTNVTSAVIDHFNSDGAGKFDDIRSPVINTTGVPALTVKFDIAYSPFSATFTDTFVVLISRDCGSTYTEVYRKGGTQLATKAGFTTTAFTPANSAEWRTETIVIPPAQLTGSLFVVFRSISGFGNRMWLDNINIAAPPSVDLVANAIVRPAATECAGFAPSLTVRNGSAETVNSFKVGYILDGGTPVIQGVNTSLVSGATTTVNFPSVNPTPGPHTIRIFVADPLTASGTADGNRGNDTLTRAFNMSSQSFATLSEGFEGTFVPANWTLINANNNNTWVKANEGRFSASSAFIDNYNNNTPGQLDILQSPAVTTAGADSVYITFDVAHKNYPGSFDRLRVRVSTDCGATFTTVYTKSGPTLATAGDSEDDFIDPAANEWRRDTVKLNNAFTGGNLIIQFEAMNDWGNNIFIDNINVTPKFKRDLMVVSATPEVQCTPAYSPSVTVRNNGTETVTAFKVAYRIGTGTPDTTTVTGISLAPNATTTIALVPRTLAAGGNILTFYTFDPVTVSGTGDQFQSNDTARRTAYVTGTTAAPFLETFEGGFPPAGWGVSNPDGGTTWQRASTGFNSNGSAYVRNYGYLANGQRDQLYTPTLTYTDVDSVRLTFDVSAATKDAPNAATAMDTLEVLVTRDCGNTFTSVYKKSGADLQTIGDVNNPVNVEFTPNAYYLWRRETINLTAFAPNGPLQVVFRNTTNNQNNVFIDNVNISTRILPTRLRAEGFIINPNPFNEQFNLWYVQAPADLRYVSVYNASGQLIWNRVFGSGSTNNVINIDLTGKAAGVYIVNLGYSDKSKDQQIRVLKSN